MPPEERLPGFHAEPVHPDGWGERKRGWVHTHGPTLVELFRLTDAACLVAALWLAAHALQLPWTRGLLSMSLLAIVAFTLAAGQWPLYRSWRVSPLRAELSRALGCICATALAVMAVLYATDLWRGLPRALLPLWLTIAYALIALGRIAVRAGLRARRARGGNIRTAAIIGANTTGLHVLEQLQGNPWMGIRVIGVFDDKPHDLASARETELTVAGSVAALKQRVAAGEVDIVYIALPLRAERLIQQIVHQLRDTPVSVLLVADFSAFGLLRASWETLGGMPMVSLVDTPHQGVDGMLKRCVDIALSSVALLVLAIPLLVIAVCIRATSPGPALFRQRRYGLDGREFSIYKFRTMTVVEDGKNAFTQARRGDARITPLGAFLRRTSLDELPQLLNVLAGDMSLVGPRPHPVALNEAQRKLIDGYMLRHKVRPGITGWAQIHGFRGETDTPEKMEFRVRYDLEYINDWSLWLDMKIIWRTAVMVLRDSNAY